MKLAKYLSLSGLREAEFASRIGMSAKAVRHWVIGDRTPRQEQMQKIFSASEGAVTPNDFLLDPQVPK